MRIAVFGTGGVGGYFGGRLAEAGEDVIFIARSQHLQAIRQHGLRVNSAKGDFVIRPAQVTDNPEQVGQVDVVMVGVKAWQISETAQAMRSLIGPETVVLPLQNGLRPRLNWPQRWALNMFWGDWHESSVSLLSRVIFAT